MRIIIIRHGETEENQQGICMGQTNGKLSFSGLRQVRLLAKKLKNEKIDIMYSSDLRRAVDTAEAILKFHKGVDLVLKKELRERSYGKLEGQKWPSNFSRQTTIYKIEDDESMCIRANIFWNNILNSNHDNIVIICHGGIKKALLTTICKLPFEKFDSWRKLDNTGISELKIDKNKLVKIIRINDTKHLKQ